MCLRFIINCFSINCSRVFGLKQRQQLTNGTIIIWTMNGFVCISLFVDRIYRIYWILVGRIIFRRKMVLPNRLRQSSLNLRHNNRCFRVETHAKGYWRPLNSFGLTADYPRRYANSYTKRTITVSVVFIPPEGRKLCPRLSACAWRGEASCEACSAVN